MSGTPNLLMTHEPITHDSLCGIPALLLDAASEVGGLAGVLDVVGDHAHKADSDGGKRIPLRLIQLAVEIGFRQRLDILDRTLIYGVVIVEE